MISVREFGQYLVTKLIGEGGMGKVWRAWKVSEGDFKKIVAIKTSKSSKNTDLFMNEAKISARFEHENIVKTFDFGKIGDEFFLVMEYVRGVDLRKFISVVEDISTEVFLYIMDRILSALSYIHDFEGRLLVHRDINAKNILVSWNGNVKLSDFGITLPQNGDFDPFGKLGYVPPEVMLGKGWSQAGDIWCVGVLMWEMLTSRKLFSGRSKHEIRNKVLSSNIPPPSYLNDSVSPEIDKVVMKALSRLPEARYSSPRELQAELRGVALRLGIRNLYQEDFSALMSSLFSEDIKEEEKEIAEEEAMISFHVSQRSRTAKGSEGTELKVSSSMYPSRSGGDRRSSSDEHSDLKSRVSGAYARAVTEHRGISGHRAAVGGENVRITQKSAIRKAIGGKLIVLSLVFGLSFGLSGGMVAGSLEMKRAVELFRKGLIFLKENNLHQAKEFFESSARISDITELKLIADTISKSVGQRSELR